MRSRPMEKRHDTSPYSGVPYLSPPPPDTWRRTNSDSALHQSANEACQSTSAIPHRWLVVTGKVLLGTICDIIFFYRFIYDIFLIS
ncbi:CREB-regulated transcription coactivator [Ooceraea biroi]|uniref:CREB-regulated transcription coactivator n=1 Tax=Ooceraea biroi TaxID=2015173 RepID=A0A026W271_OOCBI|nr:CREB-regulated transcription coactivator [Ooceraea biroi]